MNVQPVRTRKLPNSAERQIRQRHIARQMKKRRRRIAGRSVGAVLLTALVIFVILFATPIFNIRNVYIEGNNRISAEMLTSALSGVRGSNIFKVDEADINKLLENMTYVESITTEKKYFPSTLYIMISEKQPCAYYEKGDNYCIIDENCDVLEETAENPQDVPELTSYAENIEEIFSDEETLGELRKFFGIEMRIGISPGITEVSIDENNEIKFMFDDRLEVVCGSGLDMEQKLRLFKATVTNPNLPENAHGVMDLSTTGKAMYKP